MSHDITVIDQGSIFLLKPESEKGKAWVTEHIDPDAMTCGNSIVVEHRFINDIIDGFTADGLKLGAI